MNASPAKPFNLPTYRVGSLEIRPGLVLAPMSGVTDSPFRRLIKHCSGEHVGLLVSEFINIDMLTKGQMRQAIRMSFHEEERPVSLQLYGSDPETMADAAAMVEATGANILDINCGCPEPKICRRGGGAGMLRDLPRLSRMLELVRKRVSMPVTIKIRNGWDSDSINYLETLKIAEDNGIQAIAMHGRTRMQLYTGLADWNAVGELKRAARIPVLGSGDINTAEDARERLAISQCDGLLIGRGAITNPWIFRQISEAAQGLEPYQPTWRDIHVALESYHSWLSEQYPPNVAPGRMKMMLSRFLKTFPSDSGLRVRCLKMEDPSKMLEHMKEVALATGVYESPCFVTPSTSEEAA